MDFSCINQDVNPAGELHLLDEIMEISDCIFTPIVDNTRWEYHHTEAGDFSDYKAPAWNDGEHAYINRAWYEPIILHHIYPNKCVTCYVCRCRVEMFYAANIPLAEIVKKKTSRFKHGLRTAQMNGVRPHFLFGSREKRERLNPIQLQPLQREYSFFSQYHPSQGFMTVASDKKKIEELLDELNPYLKDYENSSTPSRATCAVVPSATGTKEPLLPAPSSPIKDVKNNMKSAESYVPSESRRTLDMHGSVYEGEYCGPEKHGRGVLTFANGDRYEGLFKDDRMHGKGVFVYGNGDVYRGSWAHGFRHGKGEYSVHNGESNIQEVYSHGKKLRGKFVREDEVFWGGYHNGCKHGLGKLIAISTGDMYEGGFKEGLFDGKGVLVSGTGDHYEGQFRAGLKHGQGKQIYQTGEEYEGSFRNGIRECSRAVYKSQEGDVYNGPWKNGEKHGMFTVKYANGDVFVGTYKHDKKDGRGKYTYCCCDVYTGEFKNDVFDGIGTMRYANGAEKRGTWKDGAPSTPVYGTGQKSIRVDRQRSAGEMHVQRALSNGSLLATRTMSSSSLHSLAYQPGVL
jgi:hypothetical protein